MLPTSPKPLIPEQAEPIAFDVAGAASASGFGNNVLYDAMNGGRLKARKYGRRTVIMRDDLAAWLSNLPVREARAA